jgi:AcrR family transcriptional regulator
VNGTKEKILDTAERLFSEHGYAATSLRSIIAAAGVNLAAVHYHFRSKESLLGAVITRRIEPVNRQRLAMLEECERAAGDQPPELEKIIEAFLAPPVAMLRDNPAAGPVFAKLLGRMLAEGDLLPHILGGHMDVVFQRFAAALRRALPDLPEAELLWRIHFTLGVMAHTLRGSPELANLTGGRFNPCPNQAVLERMVAFLSAGFRSPKGCIDESLA